MAAGGVDLKEAGLEASVILGKFFLGSEHLHYGYWPDGLAVEIANLPRAQEEYCAFLLANLPPDARSVLDVGCGTGALAERLLGLGLEVDCVSPGRFLVRRARARLGSRARVFECRYEDFEPDRRYDVVLFAESFQYISLEAALAKTAALLGPGGHMMICDVFNSGLPGGSALGGGHDLEAFRRAAELFSFEPVRDLDITDRVAKSLDLANRLNAEVVGPIFRLFMEVLSARRPLLARLLRWKYRAKIAKLERKLLSGERNAENFRKHRSYRLMLYRRAARD